MIGIVTGLKSEARCWSEIGGMTCCEGPGAEMATKASMALLAQDVAGLVSFGLAGGLIPELRPGTVVIANEIVLPGGQRLSSCSPWRKRLYERLTVLAPVEIPMAISDRAIVTVTDKAKLSAVTGAGTVDMESGAIALCAIAAGLPFLVVRVTADPAERTLPLAALAGVSLDGYVRPLQVLRALLQQPDQWLGLIRLSRDSRAAFAMLYRVAEQAGADLAWY